MKIVEIFVSRQGEGLWTGMESTFIRVGGCNLQCSFCDTAYASWDCRGGEDLTVEEIVGWAILYENQHVVITGGEPLLFAEAVPLTKLLAERNFIITIETNGTFDLPVACDLMSISPKMRNSIPYGAEDPLIQLHERNRNRPDIVRNLMGRYPYQLKFVVNDQEDLREIEDYLDHLGPIDSDRVLLMPMATDAAVMRSKAEWIIHYCQAREFVYCPRMQLEWYGGARGR